MTLDSRIFKLAALCTVAIAPIAAHDLYLMAERWTAPRGSSIKVYFENGDSFPRGTTVVKPERVRDAVLLENLQLAEGHTEAAVTLPDRDGIAVLSARTLPSLITLEAAKFNEYLTHEHLRDVMEWRAKNGEAEKSGKERYSKYVKSLVRSGTGGDGWEKQSGLIIEFLPEADPYTLKPGDSLSVQVLFRGKPAANMPVEASWLENGQPRIEHLARTDGAGRAVVPIRAAGPHRLHTIMMERCIEHSVADWESFWGSLTFSAGGGKQ